jgi:integrase
LTAVADWGLRNLLERAHGLGATEPEHYLLPFNLRKSRILSKITQQKWDVTRPMVTWVKSWRKLMEACGMSGFRFHDLRHYAESRNIPNAALAISSCAYMQINDSA